MPHLPDPSPLRDWIWTQGGRGVPRWGGIKSSEPPTFKGSPGPASLLPSQAVSSFPLGPCGSLVPRNKDQGPTVFVPEPAPRRWVPPEGGAETRGSARCGASGYVPGRRAWQTTPVAASPGNNNRLGSPHLVPGAQGQPLGVQSPMIKNWEATQGSLLRSGVYQGLAPPTVFFFQIMLLQQDLFVLQWPLAAPPHLSSLNIIRPSAFPASWAPHFPLPGSLPGLPSPCSAGSHSYTPTDEYKEGPFSLSPPPLPLFFFFFSFFEISLQ